MVTRLDDPLLNDEQKTDLALALCTMEGLSSSAAVRVGSQLTQALKSAKNSFMLSDLRLGFPMLLAHMETKDAAAFAAQIASEVIRVLKSPEDDLDLYLNALSAVAGNLDPKDAARTANELVGLIIDAWEYVRPGNFETLDQALSSIADRLDSKDAIDAATPLLRAMNKPQGVRGLREPVMALSILAAHMEPKDAAASAVQAATNIVRAMKDTKNSTRLDDFSNELSAVAGKLGAMDAAWFNTTLLGLLKEKTVGNLFWLSKSLPLLAPRLETKELTQTAITLLQAMKKEQDSNALRQMAETLSGIAPCMDPKDAAQAATALGQLMHDMRATKQEFAFPAVLKTLSAITARMEAQEAVTLLLRITNDTKDQLSRPLAFAFAAAASRTNDKDAASIASTLIQVMKESQNADALKALVNSFSAVANRLKPNDAAQIIFPLVQYLRDNQVRRALNWSWPLQPLSALAARLKAKDASRLATTLLVAMKDQRTPLLELAQILSGTATRMETKDAQASTAQAAAILFSSMSQTRNPESVSNLCAAFQRWQFIWMPVRQRTSPYQLLPCSFESCKPMLGRDLNRWRPDYRHWRRVWSPRRLTESQPNSYSSCARRGNRL